MKTKEAIERVRSRFDKWALDEEDLAALQALGLVAIESEDERIRKWLSDILDTVNWRNDWPYTKQQVINYLEKQKEQPTNEEMLRTLRAEYEKGVADTIAKYEQKEQKHSLNFDTISSWLRDHASRYVNGEFNEFHHCVEYDGTIDVERLIADLKVAVDGGAFDVDAAFDTREPRDNWEYIKEFCDKLGRIPKDIDELDVLVSYVMDKKQKEQKDYNKLYEDIAKSEWFKKAHEGKSLGCDYEQKEQSPFISAEESLGISQEKYNKIVDECIFGEHKEQKPTELPKSEDYGIDGLYAAIDILQKTLGEVDGYQTDDGILEHECAISAVKELYEHQPAEWGEEDEHLIDEAAEMLRKYAECVQGGNSKVYVGSLADRIESLRPQPKQEWSEEDKKMVESIIESLSWYSLHTRGAEQDVNRKKQWLALLLQRFEVTKDRESATRFLKSAGIMDENGELAEKYRSNAPQPNHNQERLEEIAAYLRYKGREDDADYIESLKK